MSNSKSWVAPLTGVVFAGLMILGFVLTDGAGDASNATQKTAQEIVDHYKDNKDQQMLGSFVLGLAAVFFLFFAGWIRKVLRDAEGAGGTLSAVSLAGAIVFVAGAGVVATIGFALADLAGDIDPIALQAINAISYDFFIPFAIGMSTFLLATGISVVRHGALPKWLGWVAIVIGVASYSPAGFFVFPLSLVWVVVVSILLTARARGGGARAAGAPA
ncbi:MAG: hypothetical protein AABM43_12020 [Actinomycetota bacterium]